MESDTSIPGFRELSDWPTPPARPFRLGSHSGLREGDGGPNYTYYLDLLDEHGTVFPFFFETFLGRLCYGSYHDDDNAAFLKKGSPIQVEVFHVIESLAATSDQWDNPDHVPSRLEVARNYVSSMGNKMMEDTASAKRFENVSFRFLGSEEDTTLSGTVIVRGKEMILVIPGTGSGPYHIVGKHTKSFYLGSNTDDDRRNDVSATWADLGEVFVGRWLESGYEYLFSFEIKR